jgi:hypothetical protein
MKRMGSCVVALVAWCALGTLPSVAGVNSGADIHLIPDEAAGDTLRYQVCVSSAVRTRVVHLVLHVPDGIRFLSWEDGEFIADPLRIGPYWDESSRSVLVALAIAGPGAVTASSGTVGTAILLRTGQPTDEVSVLEACLVDTRHREDWMATPASQIYPARRAGQDLSVPSCFAIRRVSPNPILRVTTIEFQIPRPGSDVTITFYDVTGRAVRTLVDGQRAPGYYSEVWDLSNDAGLKDTKKVIVLR